jgi:Ca-activated chloride channel family protein
VRGNRRIILLSDGIPNRGLSDSETLIGKVTELRDAGLTVSTIGLGINFNEDLLAAMANAGSGDYVYCKDGLTMANALSRELLRAHGIVAADVTAEIELPPGVRPAHFYCRSLEMDGPRLLYRLGDLAAGERRDLLVRISPARGPIRVRVQHRDLVHRQARGSELRRNELEFQGSAGPLQDYPEAVAKVELGLTCSAVPKAIELAAAGRKPEALRLIDQRISGLGLRTPRVEPVFGNVLQALVKLRSDLARVSPGDTAMRDIEIRGKLLTRDCR